MKQIKRLLIANRGEIAVRVIRTCKKLNIHTITVFSEADKNSLFVKLSDESHYIGESESSKSYLNIPEIIKVAKNSKADAVHPGYGFLSENSEFCEALKKENIIFIGPELDSIILMGDKIGSRIAMEKSGVPIVPGYNGDNQDPNHLLQKAKEIGFPVMVKATAGGGGKGMRRVDSENSFMELLESAKREAKNFFKNDKVLLERYVKSPRHIEFQVFGDMLGNVVHFYERDCSIQRRHQKVIEETPAIHLSEDLRKKMGQVAVVAAKSINYVGAGTIEFILGESGEFYFLEMNTRLQVEHPITEVVTGIDLVALQIHVAEGRELPFKNNDAPNFPKQNGHAIEARIYAEDPLNNFSPSVGKVYDMRNPNGDYIRLDTGIENNSEISIYYDPMIAKLIVHGNNRNEAIERMSYALKSYSIFGPTTNIEYLNQIISHQNFKDGNITTHFIEDNLKNLTYDINFVKESASIAMLITGIRFNTNNLWNTIYGQSESDGKFDIEENASLLNFKLDNTIFNTSVKLSYRGLILIVKPLPLMEYKNSNHYKVHVYENESLETISIPFIEYVSRNFIILSNKVKVAYYRYGNDLYLHYLGKTVHFKIQSSFVTDSTSSKKIFYSPMPGKIIKVNIKKGDKIQAGNTLIILEAMKMENIIKAHSECIIEEVNCKEGDLVKQDEVLIKIE